MRKKTGRQKVSDERNDPGKDGHEKKEKNTNWKDHFFIDSKGRKIMYLDSVMLIVIAYSCFMSMYFAAFEFPI